VKPAGMELEVCWWILRLRRAERGMTSWQHGGKPKGFVPHEVDQSSIPESLGIIQRGRDLGHFEIVPQPGAI
jgi:hypothetical protein